ncbi:MAG: hypothetical protein ACPGSB_12080 [Opitutales bacterium]
MAYEEINYEPGEAELSSQVQALVDASEERFDTFIANALNKRYPRYIASEPRQVYAALQWVTEKSHVQGNRFVEWGSGFGIATGMAALLGYEASGVELRSGLVEIARELLQSRKIKADFLCTSYIPEGYHEFEIMGGSDLVRDESFGNEIEGGAVYYDEEVEIDLSEVDLFYGYPWPGEQEMMLKLFDAVAEPDAVFIAYYGDKEVCIYRKL